MASTTLRLELPDTGATQFNQRAFAHLGFGSGAASSPASSSGTSSSSPASATTSANTSPASSDDNTAAAAASAERKRARNGQAGIGHGGATTSTSRAPGASGSGPGSSSSTVAATSSRSSTLPTHSSVGLPAVAEASSLSSPSLPAVPPPRRRVRRSHTQRPAITPGAGPSSQPMDAPARPLLELSLPELTILGSLSPLVENQHHHGQLWVADTLSTSPMPSTSASPARTGSTSRGDPLIEHQMPSTPPAPIPADANGLALFAEQSELDLHMPAFDAIARTRQYASSASASTASVSTSELASEDARELAAPVLSLNLNINISSDSLFSDLGSENQQHPPALPRLADDARYRLRPAASFDSEPPPSPPPPVIHVTPRNRQRERPSSSGDVSQVLPQRERPSRADLVRSGFWSSGVRERRTPAPPTPPPPPVPALPEPEPELPVEEPQQIEDDPVVPVRARDRVRMVQSGFWSSGTRERRDRERLRTEIPPPVPPMPMPTELPEQAPEPEAPVPDQPAQAADTSMTPEEREERRRELRLQRQRSGFWSSGARERRTPRSRAVVPPMPEPPVLPAPVVTTREPLLPTVVDLTTTGARRTEVFRDPVTMLSSTSTGPSLPPLSSLVTQPTTPALPTGSSTGTWDSHVSPLGARDRERPRLPPLQPITPGLPTAASTGTWDSHASPLRPTPTIAMPRLDFDISPTFTTSGSAPAGQLAFTLPPIASTSTSSTRDPPSLPPIATSSSPSREPYLPPIASSSRQPYVFFGVHPISPLIVPQAPNFQHNDARTIPSVHSFVFVVIKSRTDVDVAV
ncbi:hypothetical protein EXIGLDRAFT_150631 [Exidia glandulosa HHB12029]|uniref:Uncharacterized protein n=1 Tax=Exidia glandulosa HHB12029 TaxID=1314781 RepID=A0A165FK93_EXIGL|nr:hypothetical protein EXIGLDRAFT_150631 [Exidia glandulosa HHB12029]